MVTQQRLRPGIDQPPPGWTWGQLPGSNQILLVPDENASDQAQNAFLKSKGIPTIEDIKAAYVASHGGATSTGVNQTPPGVLPGANQSDSSRFTPKDTGKFRALGPSTSDPAQVNAINNFKTAFQAAVGRDITDDELNDVGFLSQLSNGLIRLLPNSLLATMDVVRLGKLDNADLKSIIDEHPEVLAQLSADRLAGKGDFQGSGFSADDLNSFISKLPPGHASIPGLRDAVRAQGGTPIAPPPPSAPPPPVPIPKDTHGWVEEVGAQDWYRRKIAEGLTPEQITQDMLREDVKTAWAARKDDPTFKDLYKYAQMYFAKTGRWPTEVEFNRFTEKQPNVPNLLPDGSGVVPKDQSGGKAGDKPKWEVPKDPLPPGYEWRFNANGDPIQWKTDQNAKDLFSGWYQDPKTGDWTYDPIAGAADYLQYNKTSQSAWGDLLNGFISRTGRLPTLAEAQNMAAQLWSGADAATKARAQQFAQIYGHFPTPFELDNGPAKDTDANQHGGGQGAAGQGQVPVFVPGIGTVLVQGETVGKGGFVFDPFNGIPGSVRPWIKELLNGAITLDQIPKEMQAWAGFALNKFQDQLPTMRPEDIPWGVPGPAGQPPPAPLPPPVQREAGKAQFLAAYKQLNPDAPDPTPTQLDDIAWLSQQDIRASRFLGGELLNRFPVDVLMQMDNDTIKKNLNLDTISRFSNDRLLGVGEFEGAGLDLDTIGKLSNDRLLEGSPPIPDEFLARLPNERVKTLPSDIQDRVITDDKRRGELGLPPKAPGTTPPPAPPKEPGAGIQPLKPPPDSFSLEATQKIGGGPGPGGGSLTQGGPSPTQIGTPGTAQTPTETGLPATVGAGKSPINIGALQAAFGAHQGDTAYNPAYDFNNDGMIDITDYAAAQKRIGTTAPGAVRLGGPGTQATPLSEQAQTPGTGLPPRMPKSAVAPLPTLASAPAPVQQSPAPKELLNGAITSVGLPPPVSQAGSVGTEYKKPALGLLRPSAIKV